MALQVPAYKTEFNKNYNFQNVIAWIAFLYCDFSANAGRIVVNVAMDLASSGDGSTPLDQVSIATGQEFDTGEVDGEGKPVLFAYPRLDQIVADNQAAFDSIRAYLYEKLTHVPTFKDGVNI
jgi:hypothetical protein